jgi:prophage antirepressor-like protein
MNPTLRTEAPGGQDRDVRASVYQFGDHKVRTAGTWDAPLFCAADVCAILTLGDTSRACERLDQDEVELIEQEKGHERVLGARRYKVLYVTESGLFSLILGSNKPEAKVFKKWVTSEEQQHRRALNTAPNGSRLDHSMLSDDGRTQLQRVVDVGVAFTRISPTWEAWKANMELTFGKKATQLPLMVPMLYAVPDAEPEA